MIRMKDIAERVGTSRATVSLVLNRSKLSERVSEKTREQILAAAKEMGYYPNSLAVAVAQGHNKVIGFVNYGFRNEFWGRVFEGISQEAEARGYYLKNINISNQKHLSLEENVENVARKCIEQRLAGVACCFGLGVVALERHLRPHGIEVIAIDNFEGREPLNNVVSDDADGCEQMVEFLAGRGFRRAALASHSYPTFAFARIRVRALLAAGARHGLEFDENFRCLRPEMGELAPEIIRDMLRRDGMPPLVVCCTDMDAYRVLQVAAELGIKVPDQLAVTGFGDIYFSRFSSPELTTVQQQFDRMGKLAAAAIIDRIESGENAAPVRLVVPTELVVRRSVGDCPPNVSVIVPS